MATRTLGGATAGQAGDLDDTATFTGTDNDSHTRKYTVAQLRTQLFKAATDDLKVGAAYEIGWDGRTTMKSPSDGVLTLYNDALSDFGRLQFGGTTSSFPALKRSTTALAVRLADDSADAALSCLTVQTIAPSGGSTEPWRLGTAYVVSPTAPDRTLMIQIGAASYFIAAKTTND